VIASRSCLLLMSVASSLASFRGINPWHPQMLQHDMTDGNEDEERFLDCTWGLWFGCKTCMLWKPPETVPVCPNAPLSLGTEIAEAVLESIPYEQVKNLHHSSIDYSLYWCDHIALASIYQTEISCRGQHLGKMAGMAAKQCHISPVPADQGSSNVCGSTIMQ